MKSESGALDFVALPPTQVCRLCLAKTGSSQALDVFQHSQELAGKIDHCVQVKIVQEDTLPKTICFSCYNQVAEWEVFKHRCHKSQEVLVNGLLNPRTATADHNDKNDGIDEVVSPENITVKQHVESLSRLCSDQLLDSGGIDEKEQIRISPSFCKRPAFASVNPDNFKKWSDSSESEEEDEDECESQDDYCNIGEAKQNCIELIVYHCDICAGEFTSCYEYLDHQEEHNGQQVFQCDKCTKVFSSRQDLVEHDRNHRVACEQCGKMILKSSMKLHLIKHTDRWMCSECSRRFNSKAALKQHYLTVHTKIKNHICEHCGKRFATKSAYDTHMRTHSDERNYQCKNCPYTGRTASALYVHMSTHANDICVCEVCSKMFKSTRNLNDHLRRVHSKVKRHECAYCDKKFVDHYMLKVHTRCHTGNRPYQCNLCDRAFIRSDGLKEHMSTHGDRVTYICNDCGKRFASKRGLQRHTCTILL